MKGFNHLVDSKIARISEAYANKSGTTTTEAMAVFLDSVTYEVLNDKETGAYLEVFECVYDMFLEERGELVA